MINWIAKIPAHVIELIAIAIIATFGATFAIDSWRNNLLLPLSSLCFGLLFGYMAIGPDKQGSYGVVFWTIAGIATGPNLVVLLNGHDSTVAIMRSLFKRLGIDYEIKQEDSEVDKDDTTD